MSSLLHDVRVAMRALVKAPTFALVTVATLAAAIGANTAIFSVVDGVLLRPLPYPDADRIVRVSAGVLPQAGGGPIAPYSDRGYWHFKDNNRSFAAFGAYEAGNVQWPLTNDGPPLSPLDPPTLVAVSVVFLAVAAVSSLTPATRAAKTPPALALRAD